MIFGYGLCAVERPGDVAPEVECVNAVEDAYGQPRLP